MRWTSPLRCGFRECMYEGVYAEWRGITQDAWKIENGCAELTRASGEQSVEQRLRGVVRMLGWKWYVRLLVVVA